MPSRKSSAHWSRDANVVTRLSLALGFLACLAYRVGGAILATSEGDWLAIATNLMGIAFFAAAIYALFRFPRAHLPATLYLLLQALHWGGPIVDFFPAPWPELLYLLVSSVVASALLLHFAMDIAGVRVPRWAIHTPAVAMSLSLILIPFGLQGAPSTIVALCLLLASVLYPLAAITLLLRALWQTTVRWTVLALIIAMLIAAIAAVVPGVDVLGRGYEPLNILYLAVIPLIIVIVKYETQLGDQSEG